MVPDKCELLNSEEDLKKALKEKKELFVLFYASWCPFSQAFLPKFVETANKNVQCFKRILVDDNEELDEKYGIEYYPTVIYFKNGKPDKKLDAVPHQGLNEPKLKGFLEKCLK